MATLSIVQGFIGSGKTTVSTGLVAETKAVRLNADEWCLENFSPAQLEQDWDECFAKSVETLWQQAEDLLKNGKDVILDFGFWSVESRDHARSKALELDVDFKHYYIFAPDDILLERMRQRPGPIAERNIRNFQALRLLFEAPLSTEEHIRIDTSSGPSDLA